LARNRAREPCRIKNAEEPGYPQVTAFQYGISDRIVFAFLDVVPLMKTLPEPPYYSSLCPGKLAELGDLTQPNVASHPFENK
jgi:hypothetical protein